MKGPCGTITPQVAVRLCTSGKFNVNTAAEKVAVVRFDQRSIEPEAIVIREVQVDNAVAAAGAGELQLRLKGLPKVYPRNRPARAQRRVQRTVLQ